MNAWIGYIGMLLILGAFIMEEFFRHTRNESFWFNVVNLLGASLLIWYSWLLGSPPFMILNGVWFFVAAVKLSQLLRR